MDFYKKLPLFLRDLILRKDINHINMTEPFNLKGHTWAIFDTEELITDAGFEFFNNLGIPLNKNVAIFKLEKHFTGPVHIDSSPQTIGFNFVISGNGVTEWVDIDGDGLINQYENGDYKSHPYLKWQNVRDINIIDSTDYSDILVRVDVPHRAVGGNEDRYLISVRPKWPCPLSFEEIVQKLIL